MKENRVNHIEYERTTNLGGGTKGEHSERWIIPTFIPKANIKALDVSHLDEEQREAMVELWAEYQNYYRAAVDALFDFETWVEHSTNENIDENIKWRTFNPEKITLLE